MPDKRKRRSFAERAIHPLFGEPVEPPSPKRRKMAKKATQAKRASEKVVCSCGCRKSVTIRTQHLHLNGRGPNWVRHGRSRSKSTTSYDDSLGIIDAANPWGVPEDDSKSEGGPQEMQDPSRMLQESEDVQNMADADWSPAGSGGDAADIEFDLSQTGIQEKDPHIDSKLAHRDEIDRFVEEEQTDLEDVNWEHTFHYQNSDSVLEWGRGFQYPLLADNFDISEANPTADIQNGDSIFREASGGLSEAEAAVNNEDAMGEENGVVEAIWHPMAARPGPDGDSDASEDDSMDEEGSEASALDVLSNADNSQNAQAQGAELGIYDVPDAWDPEAYKETGILTLRDTLDIEFVRRHAQRASNVGPSEMNLIHAFNYKVDTLQKDSAYEKMPFAFPNLQPWTTLTKLRSFINRFAGVPVQPYDCCIRSCIVYTGPYKDLNACPYCKSPRFNSQNRPTNSYHYLPLAERLAAQYGNPRRNQQLRYRSTYITKPGIIADIFDSSLYHELKNKNVQINGKQYAHRFFSDPRDVALGISFDGFCPFKRRKATCWPIIAFNYNLSPEIRFHQDNILPIGTIPGPKQMKDSNSFLLPLVNELLELARGIKVYDAVSESYFIMRVYIITAFGDMPAAAKLMNMKGHNAILPCRFCNINGVRCPGSASTIHYAPLYRSSGPTYDPLRLSLRDTDQFARQAEAVAKAETSAEQNELSKATGIKGLSVLSCLPSMTLPDSFPTDVMHLFYENLLPELLDLWTESYKGFTQGSGDYSLPPTVFKAICEAVVSSGNTIPASYGCRIPNPQTERYHFTAEAWSIWGLIVGPVVLHNRFRSNQAYTHFLTLIRLMNTTLQLEVTDEELDKLETGLAKWVVDFETIYIQKNMAQIPIATLPIHYLLHLAQSIRRSGPVWCCWAFPMERYCGSLLPAVTSRKHPFASIDRREKELEQLRNIKMRFNLHDELDLSKAKRTMRSGFSIDTYPGFILLKPSMMVTLTTHHEGLLLQYMARRFSCSQDEVRQLTGFTDKVETWGKLRFTASTGGDTIHARDVVVNVGRDMSYIKFKALVDANSRRRNAPPKLEKHIFYGQLQHLFCVKVNHHHRESGLQHTVANVPSTTYILALIHACDTVASTVVRDGSVTMLKNTAREFRGYTIVDASDILGVAARIQDRNQTFFVERPGSLDFFKNTLHIEDVEETAI